MIETNNDRNAFDLDAFHVQWLWQGLVPRTEHQFHAVFAALHHTDEAKETPLFSALLLVCCAVSQISKLNKRGTGRLPIWKELNVLWGLFWWQDYSIHWNSHGQSYDCAIMHFSQVQLCIGQERLGWLCNSAGNQSLAWAHPKPPVLCFNSYLTTDKDTNIQMLMLNLCLQDNPISFLLNIQASL